MKAVPRWAEPPPALVQYRADNPADVTAVGPDAKAVWGRFTANPAYKQTLAALLATQQGLCAYCEQSLVWTDVEVEEAGRAGLRPGAEGERVVLDSQIEHHGAKSGGPGRTLDPNNLLACCNGGAARHLERHPERYSGDRADVSCGQRKGDGELALDPRELPLAPAVLRVGVEGNVYPDPAACEELGLALADVEQAVEDVLNLNCARLKRARRARYQAGLGHIEWFTVGAGAVRARGPLLPGVLALLAAEHLAPDPGGNLRAFWSVWRQVFGTLAESWIAGNRAALNLAEGV